MNERARHLEIWCAEQQVLADRESFDFFMISGDASFRRYFRLLVRNEGVEKTYIAVDAPPEHENSRLFVQVAALFTAQGVHVPEVLATDYEQGFMLLSDLGDTMLSHELNESNVEALYNLALKELVRLQAASESAVKGLIEDYDRDKLWAEITLFDEWFLGRFLGLELDESDLELLRSAQEQIIERVLQQKQVLVHRDFHSRNLMLLGQHDDWSIAMIDFQDALFGPLSYDAVSLLKDCYVEWSPGLRERCLRVYFGQLSEQGVVEGQNFDAFLQDFHWMGLQRHLKVLGVFARLSIRDGKDGYLKDLPLTFRYVEEALQEFPELESFSTLFCGKIKEAFFAQEALLLTQSGQPHKGPTL